MTMLSKVGEEEGKELLLEVKGEDEHLGVGGRDALGEDAAVDVSQFVGVVAVQRVGEAVAELQLRYELEEGEVEVAAQTDLDHRVVALQLKEVLILAREVDHGGNAGQYVGSVVVEALGRELQADGQGDIGVFHVLRLLDGMSGIVEVEHVAEGEALRTEMHGGGDAQGEMLGQAHVGHHADAEARVPRIGIAEHQLFSRFHPLAHLHQVRSHVLQFDILHVQTHGDAEVHRPQVDVRLMLRLARLCHDTKGCGAEEDEKKRKTFHYKHIT